MSNGGSRLIPEALDKEGHLFGYMGCINTQPRRAEMCMSMPLPSLLTLSLPIRIKNKEITFKILISTNGGFSRDSLDLQTLIPVDLSRRSINC